MIINRKEFVDKFSDYVYSKGYGPREHCKELARTSCDDCTSDLSIEDYADDVLQELARDAEFPGLNGA